MRFNIFFPLSLAIFSLSFSVVLAHTGDADHVEIKPEDFTTIIDNPYFTLIPGNTYHYQAQTTDGAETGTLVVTNLRREVLGVETLVVWDRVWLEGELIEETYDWYAQDYEGSVWYFGGASTEYEQGMPKSTAGSWEAGIDGAEPGIIMPAVPTVGDTYRQEFYKGEAEDEAEIISINESVTTLSGSYEGCLKTRDFTALAPNLVEYKWYCTQVGQVVREESVTSGEVTELVSVESDLPLLLGLNPRRDTSAFWKFAGVAALGLLVGGLMAWGCRKFKS